MKKGKGILLFLLCSTYLMQNIAAQESLPMPSSITISKREMKENPSTKTLTLAETLTGSKEEIDYIDSFPYEKYRISTVPSYGSFYIDQPKDCIKGCIYEGRTWDDNSGDLIKKYTKKGSVVVDVGAHIGTHTLILSQATGQNGTVYAFEPQLKIYRELIMNMRLNRCNNVVLLRNAIGNESKIIQMLPTAPGN